MMSVTKTYPIFPGESERVEALTEYAILDTPSERDFDRLVELTARIFDVPIALVSLVDEERQFFKAKVGIDICETHRRQSFCNYALEARSVLVVPDATRDRRFIHNPLVTADPHVRFYAGAPLITPSGHILGTLCIIDRKPRSGFSEAEQETLRDLATLVMDRMQMHRLAVARRISQSRFENIAATSPDAIICSDQGGHITVWNAAAEAMFGYSQEEMLGQHLDRIVPERLRGSHTTDMARARTVAGSRVLGRTVELDGLHRDGTEFPLEISLSAWLEGESPTFGAIIRNITERRLNEEKLYRLAHLDSLTGLSNREAFQAQLNGVVAGMQPATLMMIDLDGFKDVNDTLGHHAGNLVLRDSADRLRESLGTDLTLARLGGDEFAVLLPGVMDESTASLLSRRTLNLIARPFTLDGHSFNIGASIGVAMFPTHASTAEDLLANADLALYAAKSAGRHMFRMFRPSLREAAMERRLIEAELRTAFAEGQLELFYQPQVNLATGQITGAETLLRWRHPVRGLLMPASFIHVLEISPLSGAVGTWLLSEACRQAACWRAQRPDFRIAVNLFSSQILGGGLVDCVLQVLQDNGLPPGALELEITETTILRQDEATLLQLSELSDAGVEIAFDDYGTGFASLSLLKRFPLDRLKIDRSFIANVSTDPKDAAVVKAILYLGQSFGLEVIAEGVETTEQAEFLKECGCREAQGYLFGQPMSAADFNRAFLSAQG